MSVASTTKALGIAQSDILIRSAIIEGIADIRRNPWLLDYVFASLAQDELTNTAYGEKELDQAKKWFVSTDIPVFMSTRQDPAKLPCVSIALQESVEAEQTHADIHYDTSEESEADWPILAGPFEPLAYDAMTGIMLVPVSAVPDLVLTSGMLILDAIGTPHEILEIIDTPDIVSISVALAPGVVADFRNTVIKGAAPRMVTSLESCSFRETYSIGCHVQSEASQLTYLHSIIVFILLRRKQDLLEGRGFERSSISSSQFQRDPNTDVEVSFVRYVTVAGYVRQYWPKAISSRVQAVATEVIAGDGTTLAVDIWSPDEP